MMRDDKEAPAVSEETVTAVSAGLVNIHKRMEGVSEGEALAVLQLAEARADVWRLRDMLEEAQQSELRALNELETAWRQRDEARADVRRAVEIAKHARDAYVCGGECDHRDCRELADLTSRYGEGQ